MLRIVKDDESFSLALMWAAFLRTRTQSTKNSQKASQASQESSQTLNVDTTLPLTETGEGESVASTTTYTYDNNGNTTSAGAWTYGWDYLNRMISAGDGVATTTYGYDHNNQRVKKTVGGVSTYYPFQNYTVTGTTTEKDIYANGQLIATVSNEVGTTTVYWDHSDHLGGSAVLSDPDGLSAQELRYSPFGALEYDNSTTVFTQSKKFTGTEYDSESELSYMGARYQDGVRGRFVGQDPAFWSEADLQRHLKNPQFQNSYSYALNNPLAYIDPNGDIPFLAVPFIVGGISVAFTYADDVLQNRAEGSANPYTESLSRPGEYVASFALGVVGAAFLTESIVAAGGQGVVSSISEDIAGGRDLDFKKALIKGGTSVVAASLFKGVVPTRVASRAGSAINNARVAIGTEVLGNSLNSLIKSLQSSGGSSSVIRQLESMLSSGKGYSARSMSVQALLKSAGKDSKKSNLSSKKLKNKTK